VISFLRGRLAARGADWAELDVGGVGFRLALSAHAAGALPAPGEAARLPTVLAVREDGVSLYGFRDEAEREAFTALTAVATIGGRTALAVLSLFTPESLARAIEAEDVTALTRVPGVGRKTAQRLVLELKGRLPDLGDGAVPTAAPATGPEADARAALLGLGYSDAEAAAALERVRDGDGGPADAGALLRSALRLLGGRR
jgi:Holliday junction DNA helicase RuvA